MTRRITLFSLFVIGLLVVAGTLSLLWLSGDDTATTDGPSRQPAYRTGPFQLGIELDPATPWVGKNTLTLVLLDNAGRPVSGAEIKAVAEMPAMGAMPAMQAAADMAEIEPGLYRGTFEPLMEGSWPLTLQISKAGVGSARASFDLATGRKGVQPASGVTSLAQGAGGAGNADGLPYRSGPYRLDVSIEPTTPRVGENTLSVVLRNVDGDALDNAEITAVAEMPAMGAMPAMRAAAEMSETAPGLYQGTFELPMEGSWPLTLSVAKSGLDEARLTFDMATGRTGLRLATGARRIDGEGEGAAVAGAAPGMPVITLDNRRRQLIGVDTAKVERRRLILEIRAVGEVTYDETRLADVSLKFDAWVGRLHVDYVGAPVKKGEPLFTVYGPELLAAQQEYLELERRGGASRTIFAAARKRLTLWDMTDEEIAALERRGVPYDYVPMHAPRSGTVVLKSVVEGTAKKAGVTLMRIADLSTVWVDAEVYDSELPLVREGMPVEVILPYLPDARYQAKVDYVYPYLQGKTRTGRIRLSLPNPDGRLKPDMYAEVKLQADLGERLAVPEAAVLFSGDARVVFVDLGDGRLQPRYVETGQRTEDYIEVTSGLEAGETVVTSGNFLIDAETRLKTGIKQW